jgi:transposase
LAQRRNSTLTSSLAESTLIGRAMSRIFPASKLRQRFRAWIILLRLEGLKIEDVTARMKTSMRTVSIWSSRFEAQGFGRLDDKRGRGGKQSLPAAKVAHVITEATRPLEGRNRWSVRSLARHAGISHSSVHPDA